MQTRELGREGRRLTVSALGFGCMGMSEFYGPTDDAESIKVLHQAVEKGVFFFDTADTYGLGHNEELVGRFVKEVGEQVVIATKFGIERKPGEYRRTINNSPEYIRSACEASLKRLGVERIDLYYAHRVNPDYPIEETVGAMAQLVQEGKVGHIGLSEISAQTLRKAHAVHPVTAVQTEYSLWTRDVEAEILPACRELSVGFVPYSPLGRGYLTGKFKSGMTFSPGDFRQALPRFQNENMDLNMRIVNDLRVMSENKQCSPAQIALAWLLHKGDDIAPIPGARRIQYMEDNANACEITLSADEMRKLDGLVTQYGVAGDRYTEEGMKGVNT